MRSTEGGFIYLGLLVVVMIMGAALASTGALYSHEAQREKERELIFVGHQFRRAIESYYRHSPGTNAYPRTLDDLVEDKRFPMPQHYLRRIYLDPLTGKADWKLVGTPDGAGIMGVYSPSQKAPIKTANFDAADAAFRQAKKYADWQFVYVPPRPQQAAGPQSQQAPAAK